MTPVDQLIIDDVRGDCFRASLASVLELSADEVPNFVGEHENWQRALRRWLDGRGWQMLELFFPVGQLDRCYFGRPHTYCILIGLSPRPRRYGGVLEHAVVARTKGWGVEIVHDPHPSRAGLAGGGHRYVRFIFPKP